jgi:hypothetical protein
MLLSTLAAFMIGALAIAALLFLLRLACRRWLLQAMLKEMTRPTARSAA